MEYDNRTEALPVGRLQLWWVLLITGEERKLPAKSTADPHQLLVIFLFSFIVFLHGRTAPWLGGLHCSLAARRSRVWGFTEWNLHVLLMSALGLLLLWCPQSEILIWSLGLLKDGSRTEVRTLSRTAHC